MIPAIVISKKRDHIALSTEEIQFMISGYATGTIPDYQMSALAMAIYLNGMDAREIADLTDSMIASGTRLKRVSDKPRVDKHSTGGLGDKTSLILAPLLACFDLDVPMISGRGLGITGGTLDKLEAIPGFRCNLSESESEKQLREIGCFITGATETLVPADKKLYALRDVTGTVPSIALITASIMSKKIAETLDALVLDVKTGTGAFLPTVELSEALARSLMSIGSRANVQTASLITDMNQPLGEMVGNACEVIESVEVLQGKGPRDVVELTIELCARVLVNTQKASSRESALKQLADKLNDGTAMERYEKMVAAQGGNTTASLRLGASYTWNAPRDGFICRLNGQQIGEAIIAMGGGRTVAGEPIDHSVGFRFHRKLSEHVTRGEPLVTIYCDNAAKRDKAIDLLQSAVQIEDTVQPGLPLWRDFI